MNPTAAARASSLPGDSRESDAPPYWALPWTTVAARLGSGADGLSSEEAARRLLRHGPNRIRATAAASPWSVLVRQVRSPLLLLLVFAAAASMLAGAWLDAVLVLVIVTATVGIGYFREYRADSAAAALRARLHVRVAVRRDSRTTTVQIEDVVPGDVIQLAAGCLVPADGVLIEASDLHVSEAALTGESFPVLKLPGTAPAGAGVNTRTNCVYLGTNVRSGTATMLAVDTGRATVFGGIAARLATRAPETEFDRGIRRFGFLLTRAMLTMVLIVFVAHMFRQRPPAETLLFAIALAVGLSPELLPAVLGVSLARGAQALAARGVLVRRLNAIENLGSMDVLCTDKTGTLTEGVVRLEGAYDPFGAPSSEVLQLAAWNAALETGIASPLDDAILAARPADGGSLRKRGEIPFDFVRKRVTVFVEEGAGVRLVTKGAFVQVLEACSRSPDGSPMAEVRARLERQHEAWASRGIRVLAVAGRAVEPRDHYTRDDETGLTFLGFLTFLDRPKEGADEALAALARLGVSIKMITGDNRLVASHLASQVGLPACAVLTGPELDLMSDEALRVKAGESAIFAAVDPNHKERIIRSLRAAGHVVGFLGDGVNDAPAMHAADTSLSVDQAVDVAREAADFVLLERDLDVIRRGIEEGRRIFANTLKYILTTTSANLGNMVSMAGASLLLPFLPLTAGQILLNNLLSDVPGLGIASDAVDPEVVRRPERWDMRFIGRYMLEFGILSSAFDVIMFLLLLRVFHAAPETFRTGWFVESLLTELVVALVIRTRRPFYRSRPGRLLMRLTLAVAALAVALPYLPMARPFGFVPLPLPMLGAIAAVVTAYVAATEVQKQWFYRQPGGA